MAKVSTSDRRRGAHKMAKFGKRLYNSAQHEKLDPLKRDFGGRRPSWRARGGPPEAPFGAPFGASGRNTQGDTGPQALLEQASITKVAV